MVSIASSERFSLNPDLAWRIIDGEAVILKIDTTTYYSLNPVGTFVWKEMEAGAKSLSQLVESVMVEFDTDGAAVEADLDELLGDLKNEELLQVETK